ncbi:adenosylcobinamide-phosphate synthase CbiB [Ilumatobacter sp.]|uniref:adenosylcobinamide-phosphate synthase CbiB n=1 Tax=Ilumatobacter sp. TaxID=1967498 RepID=UPI003B52474F
MLDRAVGVAVGQIVDRLVGEPPGVLHPLVHVGNGLSRLERRTHRDSRSAGTIHLALAVVGAAAAGSLLQRSCGRWLSTAIAVSLASSSKMLGDVAMDVAEAAESGDLDDARVRLRSLVGRRTDGLTSDEIARAVVESVAENTVDGVTATALWAVVGGAPLVCVHRVVNTLDAMVGHRDARYARFGWASARFDDALNWAPARLTAVAVAAVTPRRAPEIVRVVRRDGREHPSPNGGRIEAAVAASLGVTLGGANDYDGVIEVRGELGDGPPPQIADIRRAVELTREASVLLTVAATVAALAARAAMRRPMRSIGSRRPGGE